jgi:glycosyltransferase involved in cell wall biosynthesis
VSESSASTSEEAPGSGGRRLLVISYHYPPDPSIGGMRWFGLTKYLAALGWRSWVVTSARPASHQVPAGVTVLSSSPRRTLNHLYRRARHGLAGTSGKSEKPEPGAGGDKGERELRWFGRLRLEASMLVTLPDTGRGWILRAARQARRVLAQVRPHAVVSSGPPHSAHLVAWLATRGQRTRWLVDFRDPWAGPVAEAWQGEPSRRSYLGRWLIPRWERLVVAGASGLVGNTREFVAALAARYPGAAVTWVPNGVDRELLPTARAERFPGLAMAYAGTLYGGRDVRPLLRALRDFLDAQPRSAELGPLFRVAGSLEGMSLTDFEAEVAALGLQGHVAYLGMLSRTEALELLARSRLAVVLAQKQEYQVPAKLYELAAMGIPTVVIASADSASTSECRRLGGTAVEPDDVAGMVRVMEDAWLGRAVRASPDALIDYRDLAPRVSQILSADSSGVSASGWTRRRVDFARPDLPLHI